MLTGHADLEAVVRIVNEGQIFRFLLKPCPTELMKKNIEDGISQYRIQLAEKILIEQTLSGSIKVLTDILTLVNPRAFSRASRVRKMVKEFTQNMNVKDLWQLEIAAALSQIGCVSVPDIIISKVYNNKQLLAHEAPVFMSHTKVGSEMIASIPRLKPISRIIAYQEKFYNGTGYPLDAISGDSIPFGARVLKLALDYDSLVQSGENPDHIFEVIEKRTKMGCYDPRLVKALKEFTGPKKKYALKEVSLNKLENTMVLAEDLYNIDGDVLLGSKGQEVTDSFIAKLVNLEKSQGIKQPVSVLCPKD
jgi:response regulator RpfG family c-di-GMP phosphodiesterase